MKKKKYLWAALAVGGLFLAGVAGFIIFRNSPYYTFWQIGRAIKNADFERFEEFVDVDSIVDGLFGDLMEMGEEEMQPSSEWEKLGIEIGKGLVSLMKPRFKKMIKTAVKEYIESGKITSGEELSPELAILAQMLGSKEKGGIKYIKKQGRVAHVGIEVFHPDLKRSFILELRMKKNGVWRVVRFSNFKDFASELDRAVKEYVEKKNAEIKKQIQKVLEVVELKKGSHTDQWGIERMILFSMTLKNKASEPVDEWRGVIECRNRKGEVLKQYALTETDDIQPGKTYSSTWQVKVNMFDEKANELFETPAKYLKCTAEITYVKLKSGKEFKFVSEDDVF